MKRTRWDDAKYGFWSGLKAGLLHPMVLRWAFGIDENASPARGSA
jgi:hypothetical protein